MPLPQLPRLLEAALGIALRWLAALLRPTGARWAGADQAVRAAARVPARCADG